jgi:hypothetical protein
MKEFFEKISILTQIKELNLTFLRVQHEKENWKVFWEFISNMEGLEILALTEKYTTSIMGDVPNMKILRDSYEKHPKLGLVSYKLSFPKEQSSFFYPSMMNPLIGIQKLMNISSMWKHLEFFDPNLEYTSIKMPTTGMV